MLYDTDVVEKSLFSVFALIQLLFQLIVGALFTLGLFIGQSAD